MLPIRPRSVLLVLIACLATVALAACGSAGGPSSGKSDEEQQLAFADCLRDHGVDVRVTSDGRGMMMRSSGRDGPGGGPRTMRNGPDDPDGPFAICRRQTGWAPRPPTAARRAEMRDRGLRMARCMRAHGVDMPDPAPDGRMTLRVEADSPTFRAAARACGIGVPGGGAPGGEVGMAIRPR